MEEKLPNGKMKPYQTHGKDFVEERDTYEIVEDEDNRTLKSLTRNFTVQDSRRSRQQKKKEDVHFS